MTNEQLARKIIYDISEAIKEFGEYTYYDKGANEVMSVTTFVDDFRDMSIIEVRDVLAQIMTYKHGKPFVSDAIQRLSEYLSDEDYRTLLEDEAVASAC